MMEEMEEKVVELFPGSKFVPVGDSTVLQVHEEEPLSEFDWSAAIEPLYRSGHVLNWCCCISSTESNSVLQPGQHFKSTPPTSQKEPPQQPISDVETASPLAVP